VTCIGKLYDKISGNGRILTKIHKYNAAVLFWYEIIKIDSQRNGVLYKQQVFGNVIL